MNYQTVAVNATPGLDFVPTSGTLTFASGQTVGTIAVPVLNDPWENHNDSVNLVLSSPGAERPWARSATAQLSIIDTDPDTTPPRGFAVDLERQLKGNHQLQPDFHRTAQFRLRQRPGGFPAHRRHRGPAFDSDQHGLVQSLDLHRHPGAFGSASIGPVLPDRGRRDRRDRDPRPGRQSS